MGAVSAAVAEATFYGFSTAAVQAVLPAIWERATPAEVLATHHATIDAVMRRRLGDVADDPATARAAELLHEVVQAADVGGRPLAAGHRGLPWPDAPHVALVHGLTVLREHRGDGHVAALVNAGIDSPECHVLLAAAISGSCECHQRPRDDDHRTDKIRLSRRYSEQEWSAASARLATRGLLDADGRITDDGMHLHVDIERQTDASADRPFAALGADGLAQLDGALAPATRALEDTEA
jgi:hypothetical protein